jgi:hypothetical protein
MGIDTQGRSDFSPPAAGRRGIVLDAARGLAAAGVLLSADVHLDLWDLQRYRQIHIIGALFLLNVVAGLALGIAVLVWRHWLPSLAAAGFGAATLAVRDRGSVRVQGESHRVGAGAGRGRRDRGHRLRPGRGYVEPAAIEEAASTTSAGDSGTVIRAHRGDARSGRARPLVGSGIAGQPLRSGPVSGTPSVWAPRRAFVAR